jgi:hypothetical protein
VCGGAALELANMATLLLQPGGLYGRFMHYPQQQLTSTIHEPQVRPYSVSFMLCTYEWLVTRIFSFSCENFEYHLNKHPI